MDKNNKPFMGGNVELAGVDFDKTTYTPNKKLIDWAKLGYDDASVAFLKEDSGTNYKAIVQLAIQAVGTAASGPTGGAVTAVINIFITAPGRPLHRHDRRRGRVPLPPQVERQQRGREDGHAEQRADRLPECHPARVSR
jgi:hypothetical protein